MLLSPPLRSLILKLAEDKINPILKLLLTWAQLNMYVCQFIKLLMMLLMLHKPCFPFPISDRQLLTIIRHALDNIERQWRKAYNVS